MNALKRYAIKSVMFISSYFPLYIMLLILHHQKYVGTENLKQLRIIVFLMTMLIGISISIISLFFLIISRGNKSLIIEEIDRPDDTIISYMMTYIIPILTTNTIDKGELTVNIILFILIGYLYVRLNLLYLNPLWSIFGYLSYRINSDLVIVTNIDYQKLKNAKANNIEVIGFHIANDIFVAQKKDNNNL